MSTGRNFVKELDAWLVVAAPAFGYVPLRVARDAGGTSIVPTAQERADAAETRVRELEARLSQSGDR